MAENTVLSTLRSIKIRIQELIHENQLEEAEKLLDQYEKIMSNDIDIFSMKSIICIYQNQLDQAKYHLLRGLEFESDNFDITYNLAYVYELQGDVLQAYIHYRKARNLVLYNGLLRNEVETLLSHIENKFHHEGPVLLKQLIQVNQLLLIDFNVSQATHLVAEQLSTMAISVDLVDWGRIMPTEKINLKSYRKQLHFYNLDEVMEYVSQYQYDVIHIMNAPKLVKERLPQKYKHHFIFTDNNEKEIAVGSRLLESYALTGKKAIASLTQDRISLEWSLTIVIPTYNRPHYLERVISNFGCYQNQSFVIYVLDSSNEEIKQQNKKMIASFSQMNIKYLAYDPNTDVFEKLNDGIQAAETEFICLCADDDFISELGIVKSLETLKNDPSLFSVKGKNLYFLDKMSQTIEYDHFKGLYDDDSYIRMELITKGFVPSLIYQVFRTLEFKNLYAYFSSHKDVMPKNPTFREYLLYFMVIITGKIGRVIVDFNIRDKGAERETNFKNFPHAVKDGTFNTEYQSLRNTLRKYWERVAVNTNDFDKLFQSMFSSFLINFLGVPDTYIDVKQGEYDLKKLEVGMRKSWVWPSNL